MGIDLGVGASPNDWVQIVRRARLRSTVKLVALVLATYADKDGRRIFPGVARLAVQSGVSYSTVRAAIAVLRRAGLIELVRRGARKAHRADEYRLILAEDVLERVEVLTPDREAVLIEELNRSNVVAGRKRSSATTEALETASLSGQRQVLAPPMRSARTGSSATADPFLAPASDRPTSIEKDTLHEVQPPSHSAGVRTDLALTRARPPDSPKKPRPGIGLCVDCAKTGTGRNRLVPAVPGTDHCQAHTRSQGDDP